MSQNDRPESAPRPEVNREMRRAVSRRSLIRDELGRASLEAVKQLPSFAGVLGFAFKETPAQRDERLMKNLWQLLTGREPKPEEAAAGLELLRNAATPDAKSDALVDILWALCQTQEFDDLNRPDSILVRGLYRIALDREPRDDEKEAALRVLAETPEAGAKGAALEGLLTGLLRSAESVFYKTSRR
jgi:hypothetical protein